MVYKIEDQSQDAHFSSLVEMYGKIHLFEPRSLQIPSLRDCEVYSQKERERGPIIIAYPRCWYPERLVTRIPRDIEVMGRVTEALGGVDLAKVAQNILDGRKSWER